MTATSLSSGPLFGVLSATGTAPQFSSTVGWNYLWVVLSPLAWTTATVTLLRSADGGTTWAPVTGVTRSVETGTEAAVDFQGQVIETPNAKSRSRVVIYSMLDQASCLYQLQVTLNGGSVFYLAYQGGFPAFGLPPWELPPYALECFCNVVEPGTAYTPSTAAHPINACLTTAQLLQLSQARTTPLAASAIAAPLTLYSPMALSGNVAELNGPTGSIATLSVPAGAVTCFDYPPNSFVGSVATVGGVGILTVTSVNPPWPVFCNSILTASGVPSGTFITGFQAGSGTLGGAGKYTLSAAFNLGSTSMTGIPAMDAAAPEWPFLGMQRVVSASAATVTALVDKDGNALDPSTYVPNPYGFFTGFTTMLEAACFDAVNKNFAAYGL